MRLTSLSLLTILCAATLIAPAYADDLYNNGPTNGTSNAYAIDIYAVSDSFIPESNLYSDITDFSVALWTPAGATPLTVDWAIGTSSFGSNIGSGSGEWSGLTLLCRAGQPFNGGICAGGFGYDVYDANMSTGSLVVTPGNTYWLTLTRATDSFDGRDGWDINSGGSMAFHNLLGSVPSESLTINGFGETTSLTGTTPEPTSIIMFGSGVLGLVGLLRRKLL